MSNSKVNERLVAITPVADSSGEGTFNLIKEILESLSIDIRNCVAIATDGASNMRGCYNGLISWFRRESPDTNYVWCYAHVLNLVITDSTKCTISALDFFSLINGIAVFFRDSYKRMNIWREQETIKKLQMICDTRWWSKDNAMQKIFGIVGRPETAMYPKLILALEGVISKCNATEVKSKAKAYLEHLLKYETVNVAIIFMRIFQQTSPLSKYLQASGLDVLKAYELVDRCLAELKAIQRYVKTHKHLVDSFITCVTQRMHDCYSVMEDEFPEHKRKVKRKKMFDESTEEEVILSVEKRFEVETYNTILFDVSIQSLEERFASHRTLYADLSCLSPTNFIDLKDKLPQDALLNLCNILQKYYPSISHTLVHSELQHLINNWDMLKGSILDEYESYLDNEHEDNAMSGL